MKAGLKLMFSKVLFFAGEEEEEVEYLTCCVVSCTAGCDEAQGSRERGREKKRKIERERERREKEFARGVNYCCFKSW